MKKYRVLDMRVKFFLCINKEVNSKPDYPEGMSNEVRSRLQLDKQLETLSSVVERASMIAEEDVLPVVVCGEDFFQGAEIASREENLSGKAHCYSQDIAYDFIANKLTELSQRYRNVLIIPGSMYVSVPAPAEGGRYEQNVDSKRTGRIYVQNIAPVLFDGELLRIIKKGDYLQEKFQMTAKKVGRRILYSEEEHAAALKEGNTMVVPCYAEDELEDIKGLVFLGKTPLPGEESLITALGIRHPDLFLPVFTVRGVNFGVEICHDHSQRLLDGEDLDFHIITSHGISWMYNACGSDGYRVQADADSIWLTNITRRSMFDIIPFVTTDTPQTIQYHESPELEVLKLQQEERMLEIAQLIGSIYLSASPTNGAKFAGKKSSYVEDLKDIPKKYQAGKIQLMEALRKIIEISEPLITANSICVIKGKAEELLDSVREPHSTNQSINTRRT